MHTAYIAEVKWDLGLPMYNAPNAVEELKMDPFSRKLFLFCGKRSNRMKALLWEEEGFVLLYNRPLFILQGTQLLIAYYTKYHSTKKEMKNILIAKANIDRLLGEDIPGKEKRK